MTKKQAGEPKRYWIHGDKAYPDGPLVPDKYGVFGSLYIEHSAYEKLEQELEHEKENAQQAHAMVEDLLERIKRIQSEGDVE